MDIDLEFGENFKWKEKSSAPYKREFFQYKLVDYCDGELDSQESAEFESWLKENPEYQKKVEMVRSLRLDFARLHNIEFSQKIIEDIAKSPTYLPFMIERLKVRDWPDLYSWAIQALVVVFAMVFVLVIVPWENTVKKWITKNPQSIILAEIKQAPEVIEPASVSQFSDEIEDSATETQIVVKAPDAQTPKPDKTDLLAPTPGAVLPGLTIADILAPPPADGPTMPPNSASPPPTTSPPPKPPPPTQPPAPKEAKSAVAATQESDATTKEKAQGSLYRGTVFVTNLEAVWPKIKERLEEMGARKAGDVELGWKKSNTLRYFHFTIPEAQLEPMKEFIDQYGKLQYTKEKHARVMPDGIIRLIINVNEKLKVEPDQ